MLHCADSEAESTEKIQPFINSLLEEYCRAFYPFQELSLDEMVFGWKSRFKYKTYNPNKPAKYHVKTFGLCDSATSYVINLLPYFGAETAYDPSFWIPSLKEQ
ncbi:PiggyBac transposable element-derived protein 4 [Plakobranchus ocellatus]|uniref:PiggyBac transposable element-derived protein 4 n=1 Tax=Plakobranchus ocellatus TaxID=259542 RepID=A0AAV4CP76_9GAST|nr:PiggyBac transposable element-derived protein 4 [Plakobranchus ocellatus]